MSSTYFRRPGYKLAEICEQAEALHRQRMKRERESEDAARALIEPTQALSFSALLEQEATSVQTPMLIADIFPTTGINVVAGDSTIGKSALVLQMAACVAGGVPFLGKPTQRGKVLIADWENADKIGGILQRVAKAAGVEESDLREDVTVLKSPRPEELLEFVKRDRPAFVTMDALRWFLDGLESKTETVARRFRELSECSTCWVLVHHLRKQSRDAEAPDLADSDVPVQRWFQEASGSLAITNQSFTRMGVIAPSKGADLLLRWVVKLQGEKGPLHVQRLIEDGDPDRPIGYALAEGWELLGDAERNRYMNVAGRTMTFAELVAEFGAKSKASRLLSACSSVGVVEGAKAGGGKARCFTFKPLPGSVPVPSKLLADCEIAF